MMSLEDLPNLKKYMFRLAKTKDKTTVYLLNEKTKTRKPINSAKDYFALTDDNKWEMIETISNEEMESYQLRKKIYIFERI